MNMKLNPKHICPPNNTLVFALNNDKRIGFVGILLFLDGKYFSMPENIEFKGDFFWIELNTSS